MYTSTPPLAKHPLPHQESRRDREEEQKFVRVASIFSFPTDSSVFRSFLSKHQNSRLRDISLRTFVEGDLGMLLECDLVVKGAEKVPSPLDLSTRVPDDRLKRAMGPRNGTESSNVKGTDSVEIITYERASHQQTCGRDEAESELTDTTTNFFIDRVSSTADDAEVSHAL